MSDDKTDADLFDDDDDEVDKYLPGNSDDWPSAQRKYEAGRRLMQRIDQSKARKFDYVLHHGLLGAAVANNQIEHTDRLFAEMVAMAEEDGDGVYFGVFCNNGSVDDLLRARINARDRQGAEEIARFYQRLAERFAGNEDVEWALMDVHGLMAVLCSGIGDAEAAVSYFNSIAVSFSGRSVSEQRIHWFGDVGHNIIANFIRNENYGSARGIGHSLKEILLDEDYLRHLAEEHGATHAADFKDLVEAQVEAFESEEDDTAQQAPGEGARRKDAGETSDELGEILDDYGFGDMVERTFFDFITMVVPRRWQWLRDDDSEMWGLWEEGIESGTLWVDFDVYSVEGEDNAAFKLVRGSAERIAESAADRPNAIGDPFVQEIGDGYAVMNIYTSHEKGHDLIHYSCHTLVPHRQHALLVHFTLVLLAELADRPDFVWLRERMALACLDARIDVDAALAGGPTR